MGNHRSGGKNRKPREVKVLEGTFRADRHGSEIDVPAAWPPPPSHLTETERELWTSLEAHCKSWTAASDFLAINGVVSLMAKVLKIQAAQNETDTAGNPIAFKYTPSADGEPNMEPKENPLYGMELKTWRELRAFIGLMGLSPVDRARMHKPSEEKPVSNLARFLK